VRKANILTEHERGLNVDVGEGTEVSRQGKENLKNHRNVCVVNYLLLYKGEK